MSGQTSVSVERQMEAACTQTRTYTLLSGSHSRTEIDPDTGRKDLVNYDTGENIELTLREARSPAFDPTCDGPRLELYREPTEEEQFDFSYLATAAPKEVISTINACDDLSELEVIWAAEESRTKARVTVVRSLEAKKAQLLGE